MSADRLPIVGSGAALRESGGRLSGPFRDRRHFDRHPGPYRLLPFRFMRWSAEEVLLVNDVGEIVFLPSPAFEAFASRRLSPGSAEYEELASKHFLHDSPRDTAIELLATKYRTKKAFLRGFTSLHLFVVTLRCDHSCHYCQVSRVSASRERFDMSEATARRAIDLMFRSPSPHLKVEIQGGEPLLAFDRLRFIVDLVLERNEVEGREVEIVVATSLSRLTDGMIDYFRDRRVLISTSLDGPAFVHDVNRPRKGRDGHRLVTENVARLREALGRDRVSAVMTTTELTLGHPRAVVDEYVRLGFDAIFLRPISPYGFAVRTGEAARYESDRFLTFYREALDHVLEVNRRGYDLAEVYAQILLTRMLTPFATGYVDLQSPAGTVLGAVAYNYDGDVYASDEARMLAAMGDTTFRLGNVHADSYEALFAGEVAHALTASSVIEALPGCADCAFLPFCGTDPVFHHRTQGDFVGHRPSSGFCAKNMGIFRHLLELLRGPDEFVRDLLTSWATGVPPGEVPPPPEPAASPFPPEPISPCR